MAVEKAAKQLCADGGITETQKKCVSLAFDEVGIPGGTDDDTQAEHIKTIDELFRDYLEGKLIPKYGVMTVKELSVERKNIGTYDVWPRTEEFQGILAAEIYDYDNDGRHEMLLIRATSESIEGKELSSSLDMGGGIKLYMEMFEWTGHVELAASRKLPPCGKYQVTYHQIQTGFFTYADKGTVYIGVDSNFRMNETITTLALYQYKDNAFRYVKGICRQRQGSGYEAVLTADKEPKERSITFAPSYSGEDNGWTVLDEYDWEKKNYEKTGRQESIDKLDSLYRERLERYGLISNDLRLDWEQKNWKAKTRDIYTSRENNLTVVASIVECTELTNETTYYLYKEDPAGSMNAYR